ncbi:MAG: type II toxin-antitoxin system VapC family toxin, partial [Chloroflexota bacterium]|nr:type II toxin-antitoxin system VapC family toxin [Chloroflexota bacterium]
MSGYVLDTTLLIDHATGRRDGVEILARLFGETGALYACDITTSEALSGGPPEERAIIARLLDALEYLVTDPEGARWAGDRRRELRAQGRRSPLGDSLIAAVAWRMEATIVTRNPADFELFGVPVLGYGEPPAA